MSKVSICQFPRAAVGLFSFAPVTYAFSGICVRDGTDGDLDVVNETGNVASTNSKDAEEQAQRFLKAKYPRAEGWHDHAVRLWDTRPLTKLHSGRGE